MLKPSRSLNLMFVGHSVWGADRGSADSHPCIGPRAGRPYPGLEISLESQLDNVLGFERGHREAKGGHSQPAAARAPLDCIRNVH